MFAELESYNLSHIISAILQYLHYLDILSCLLVCKSWNRVTSEVLRRLKRYRRGWLVSKPKISRIPCVKSSAKNSRFIPTIKLILSDERYILLAVGEHDSNIELWKRNPLYLRWINMAVHEEIYSLDMNTLFCASGGGKDGSVKIWELQSGTLLQLIQDQKCIVWNVVLRETSLVTLSNDRSVAKYTFCRDEYRYILDKMIYGPLSWSYALGSDYTGNIFVTRTFKVNKKRDFRRRRRSSSSSICPVDMDYSLNVWDLTDSWTKKELCYVSNVKMTLEGHQDEIYSVRIRSQIGASGSKDGTVRLWDMNFGECLCVFKVDGVDSIEDIDFDDNWLIVTEYGRVRIWNFEQILHGDAIIENRALMLPSRHLVVKLEKVGLICGDGEGHVFHFNFWDSNFLMEELTF